MVTCEDIARYTVSILDDPRTVNRHVAISPRDNLYSQNELIAYWEKQVGLKLKRNVVSDAMLEGAIKDLASKPEKMLDLIYTQLTRAAWILGIASRKRPDALEATELYPDIKYERVKTFLDRFASKPLVHEAGLRLFFLSGLQYSLAPNTSSIIWRMTERAMTAAGAADAVRADWVYFPLGMALNTLNSPFAPIMGALSKFLTPKARSSREEFNLEARDGRDFME